jgi:hypothetical protein
MSIEIVNGYVCRDCTDVERARKGEDPAQPAGAAATLFRKASADDEPLSVNRPLATGARGTVLNLLL